MRVDKLFCSSDNDESEYNTKVDSVMAASPINYGGHLTSRDNMEPGMLKWMDKANRINSGM